MYIIICLALCSAALAASADQYISMSEMAQTDCILLSLDVWQ